MRITKRPSLEGSPERTAISAPFGNVGGAGPHLTSPELMGIFISSAMAALHTKTIAKAINRRGITTSFLVKHHSVPVVKKSTDVYLRAAANLDANIAGCLLCP